MLYFGQRPEGGASSAALLVLRQGSESSESLVMQAIVQNLPVILLWLPGFFELHVGDLLNDVILHCVVDRVPINLQIPRELRHALLRCLMEPNNDLHHPDRLCQRAHEVVSTEAILLQKIF